LRVFPLLRQSTETRTLGGLLLNEGYVNFGFFHEAIRKHAEPPELMLSFGVRLLPRRILRRDQHTVMLFPVESMSVTCELRYTGRGKDQRNPSIRSVRFILGNHSGGDIIEICSDETGKITKFQVNDYQCDPNDSAAFRLRIGRGVVPVLLRHDNLPANGNLLAENPFNLRFIHETDQLLHSRTTRDKRLAIFRNIEIGSPAKMLATLQAIDLASWRTRVRAWTVETAKFRRIRNLVLANAAGEFLNSMHNHLAQFAHSVHYFQPVRASVERDYLSRDVPVSRVDSQGVNVAMVLASMELSDLQKFRVWMQKYFGFEVFPQSVGDGVRVALRMRESNSPMEFNLADMGFGFSQMLPFLVQIWSLVEGIARRPRYSQDTFFDPVVPLSGRTIDYLITIEQPELHLHPALQARLVDLFVSVAQISRENKLPVRFMLETHSQTFLERIGQLIEQKALDKRDVQVLLFEREHEHDGKNLSTATVRTVQYDDEGVLQDWPFGFLAAPPFDPVPEYLRPLKNKTIVT